MKLKNINFTKLALGFTSYYVGLSYFMGHKLSILAIKYFFENSFILNVFSLFSIIVVASTWIIAFILLIQGLRGK